MKLHYLSLFFIVFGSMMIEATEYKEGTYPAFEMYKLDVTKNGGADIWCLEELKFFNEKGQRLETPASGASAQTQHNGNHRASTAFNELSNNDDSYYCSASNTPTGWLQYTFEKKTKLSQYQLEALNDHNQEYSPNDWKFYGKNEGGSWVLLDEQTGITNLKKGQINNYELKKPEYTKGIFPEYNIYRMDVTKNGGSTVWCIQEFKFYNENGERLDTPLSGASAQTHYSDNHASSFAFDEVSNNDEKGYCSAANAKTGWLQYKFGEKTKISKYAVEARHSDEPQAPNDWKFYGSDDGLTWVLLDEQKAVADLKKGKINNYVLKEPLPIWLHFGTGRCPKDKNVGYISTEHGSIEQCKEYCESDSTNFFSLWKESGTTTCGCYSDCDEIDENIDDSDSYEIISATMHARIEEMDSTMDGLKEDLKVEKDALIAQQNEFNKMKNNRDLWKNRFNKVEDLEEARQDHSDLAKEAFPDEENVATSIKQCNEGSTPSFMNQAGFMLIGAGLYAFLNKAAAFGKTRGDEYNAMLEI